MAWTQQDIDIIEKAIANSEERVRFSDGREVQYRSIDSLIQARQTIQAAVQVISNPPGSPGVRSTIASFRKD